MPDLRTDEEMTKRRNDAARRALAPETGVSEGAPEAPSGSAAPAASPAAIRHEGYGGYTYSFDPQSQELTILEDPTGQVPAGYVVPKESKPYLAILDEMMAAQPDMAEPDMAEPDMAEPEPDYGDPDPEGTDYTDHTATPRALRKEVRRMREERDALDDWDLPAKTDVRSEGEGWKKTFEFQDEEEGESLEGLEARLEQIRGAISEKRKKVRERVKQRGAEAAAPPNVGGAQAQDDPRKWRDPMFGGGGASYEGT